MLIYQRVYPYLFYILHGWTSLLARLRWRSGPPEATCYGGCHPPHSWNASGCQELNGPYREEWWRMMKNDEEWWRMMKNDEEWMKNGDWMEIWSCFQTDQTFFPGFDMVLRYSLGGVVPWASLLPFDLVTRVPYRLTSNGRTSAKWRPKTCTKIGHLLVVTRLAMPPILATPPIHPQFAVQAFNFLLFKGPFCHRIGWWEHLQESPIFDGKNHGFRLRFSLKPIQWFWYVESNFFCSFLLDPSCDPHA